MDPEHLETGWQQPAPARHQPEPPPPDTTLVGPVVPPWYAQPVPPRGPYRRPGAPPWAPQWSPGPPRPARPVMYARPAYPPPVPRPGLLGWWQSQSHPVASLLVALTALVVGVYMFASNGSLALSIPVPIIEQVAPGLVGGSAHSAPPHRSAGNIAGSPSTRGAVTFSDSQSSDTGGATTIDDDGTDPSPTGSPDHQGQTSYANGRLGALHTNYFALNPGWASAHGIVLGDVGALTYHHKTVFAVYGDNHVGDTPHAEISVASAMALTGQTNAAAAENSLGGVHFAIYPGTHNRLGGSVSQRKINQIGSQASGL